MSKRRAVEIFEEDVGSTPEKVLKEPVKKHTLDSDEEDSGEEDAKFNKLDEDDIEGEEDGISGMEGEIKFTPFNMKEELEEGHFDRDGHFQWDKTKDIRDNWLDNIDWIKVKTDKKYIEKTNRGLADSSDSEGEGTNFNELETYKKIIEMMKPGETIQKTMRRLGANTVKLSSVERWKRKKAGIVEENDGLVAKLTEWTNDILTNLGNMDIYQETYEFIMQKINRKNRNKAVAGSSNDGELDMYADDFDTKEKSKLELDKDEPIDEENDQTESENLNKLMWEFKWKQDDSEIHGPFSTEQMQNWVDEKYFKEGVFVRKCGEDTKFYTSNRIDFDLYL